MLYGLLLTLNALVCAALVGVVLMQRSEGGALGQGGGPTGLITTRGAGDLLTRTTWILFAMFLSLSLALTLIGARERSSQAILNRLKLQSVNPNALPLPGATPAPTAPSAPTAPIAPVGAPVGLLNPPPQAVAAPRVTPPPAAPVARAPKPEAAKPAPEAPKPAAKPAAKPVHAAAPAAAAPAAPVTITPPPPPKAADVPAKSDTP